MHETVKQAQLEHLDNVVGPDFARVTLITDPLEHEWDMTRERACSMWWLDELHVWTGPPPSDRDAVKKDFLRIFGGASSSAPPNVWGRADAFFVGPSASHQMAFAAYLVRNRGTRIPPQWTTPADVDWAELLPPKCKEHLAEYRALYLHQYGGNGPMFCDLEQGCGRKGR